MWRALDELEHAAGNDLVRACTTDLAKFKLPTLVIHGDSDAIVPFEVSGARTHKVIPGSLLKLVKGAPHGFNLSHAAQFNQSLLEFLAG